LGSFYCISDSKINNENVYIVIPTYQEIEGIGKIIASIFAVDSNFRLIIVDDKSPDGTAEFVRSLDNDNIVVIVRSGKLGIGSAIREGMKRALSFSDCQFIVTMDADMSHDPLSISDLLAKANQCDMVQGSRFVAGGKDVGRPWHRQFISKVANFLYRFIFGLKQKEVTTYFRVYSRKCAEVIVANAKANKYEFAMESALIIKDYDLVVMESPITFVERREGKSKLTIRELIRSSFYLLSVILKRNKQTVNFCIVGAIGIVVNQGLLWFLTEIFGIYYLYSALMSIEMSILSNFILNDHFTFGGEKRDVTSRLLKYNLTCIVGSVLNYILLWVFTDLLHVYYLISNLLGIVIAFAWNYSVSVKWVWKKY
jgi:dolichol-phosphate mannosyltransferase